MSYIFLSYTVISILCMVVFRGMLWLADKTTRLEFSYFKMLVVILLILAAMCSGVLSLWFGINAFNIALGDINNLFNVLPIQKL